MQRRYRKPKPQKELVKKFRANLQIKVPNIFVINDSGEKLGVMPTREALKKAEEAELDLVEVSPQSNPPVAKIMDYGQYKYEREKQIKKAKAHQKTAETKSIRLSFRIKGQDLETRKKQALKFLEGGNKVKINTMLKGREKAHRAIAIENIKEFIASLGEDIKIVQPVTPQGGQINATISKS